MPTLFHPTIPDVTFDATDDQLEEAEAQGWLAEEPDYAAAGVTVERLGVDTPAQTGFVDRTAELTKTPTGPGAAKPADADKA